MQNIHNDQNFNMSLTANKQSPPTFNTISNTLTQNTSNQTFFHKYANPVQRSEKSNSLVFANSKANGFKNQLLNSLSPQSKSNLNSFGQNEKNCQIDLTKNMNNCSIATHDLPI